MPTLVMHCRHDGVIPCSEGAEIAASIRDAEFVQLESHNHILLPDEPAWERVKSVVLEFTGAEVTPENALFAALSGREREVLTQITTGLSNSEISERLFISESTVKNHITNIFEKLDVSNRSQAIVRARDAGFPR